MCRCGAYNGPADGRHSGDVRAARSAPVERRLAQRDAAEAELTYVGGISLLLKGPVSRRVYALSPDTPRMRVDARDLSSLVASGMFEPV